MKLLRWVVRLSILAGAALLALGGLAVLRLGEEEVHWAVRMVPSLSPLTVFTSAMAHRGWYLALFWLAGPAMMVILAFWKGRLFCRWICPVGTLVAIPSRISLKKTFLRWRINAVLFWLILTSSLVGLPLLLLLDPLSTFQRLGPWVNGLYFTAAIVPGLILPALLVLCVIQPMVWCTHICPLGYGLELMRRIRKDKPKKVFLQTRRELLIGAATGLTAGVLARLAFRNPSTAKADPILPPGAKDAANFAGTCIRCYACVAACPTKIIQPAGMARRAPHQWFQPEVKYRPGQKHDHGYCVETCTTCSHACPTGAIRQLTLKQKRQRKIGTAEVIRPACLAWAEGEYCMVCQEHCPYGAIDIDYSTAVPCPIVRPELCRGCGQCFRTCPAIKHGKALRMLGVESQSEIDDGYADFFE